MTCNQKRCGFNAAKQKRGANTLWEGNSRLSNGTIHQVLFRIWQLRHRQLWAVALPLPICLPAPQAINDTSEKHYATWRVYTYREHTRAGADEVGDDNRKHISQRSSTLMCLQGYWSTQRSFATLPLLPPWDKSCLRLTHMYTIESQGYKDMYNTRTVEIGKCYAMHTFINVFASLQHLIGCKHSKL